MKSVVMPNLSDPSITSRLGNEAEDLSEVSTHTHTHIHTHTHTHTHTLHVGEK